MNHTAQGYEATGLNPNYQPHTATEILKTAASTLGERGKQYDPAGKQERSMTAIVQAFNAIYPHNLLTVHMGWQFMSLVKMVRGATKPHADSALDQVAYAALAAECVAECLHQPVPTDAQAMAEALSKHEAQVEKLRERECLDIETINDLRTELASCKAMTAKFQAERKANVAMHKEVTRLRGKVQELADLAEYRDKRNAELCAELESQRGSHTALANASQEFKDALVASTRARLNAQEEVIRLKSEATEARKRGSADYNKQVAIQAELKQRNKELEEKVQSLNNEVEAKVRELMSHMKPEPPIAHNTDEPKATRAEYVDPFDQYGDMRSPYAPLGR